MVCISPNALIINNNPDYELMVQYEWSNSNIFIFEPWGSWLGDENECNPLFNDKMILYYHTSFKFVSINYINKKMIEPRFKNIFLIRKDVIHHIVNEIEKKLNISINKNIFIVGIMSLDNKNDDCKSYFRDLYLPIIKKYTIDS